MNGITREQRDRLMRLHDTTYLNVPGTAKHADAERDFIAALDSLVAEPAEQPRDAATDAPCVLMPTVLTYDDIKAIRTHGTTQITDRDDWHTRLGWLICAWDVLIERRRQG